MLARPAGGQAVGLGHNSFDAVALASLFGYTLYADDLGLRRYALSDTPPASFSTLGLLPVLVDRGLVLPAVRDHDLSRMVLANYGIVLPTAEMLEEAVCHSPARTRGELMRLFGILGNPHLGNQEAAGIAVAAIKRIASRRVGPAIGFDDVTDLAVRGMASAGRPLVFCARLVAQRAQVDLLLLPHPQAAVRQTCEAIATHSTNTLPETAV